jgi:plastocyanin
VHLRSVAFGVAALALGVTGSSPALAKPARGPSTLVIGVDHVDPANQRPDLNRVLEYTDFFSRSVTVHRHEVLDFRTAPGALHAIGLARDEDVARRVYPIATLDKDDPNAIGSRDPKIALGPSNGFIIGGSTHGGGQIGDGQTPPSCGLAGEKVCTFKGGGDIEAEGPLGGTDAQGNPVAVDWSISIDAPPGDYDYLCFLHPGMQGRLHVVDGDDSVTSQAANDARSDEQFERDQAQGLAAEAAANVVRFRGGVPGTRTYQVDVSVASPDLHATMLEMLPQHLDLKAGDKVEYHWEAPNEVHTVGFPNGSALPPPFGFDCGATFQNPAAGPPCTEGGQPPELIGDPGLSPSGTALSSPSALVDSGVLPGRGYHLEPTTQRWSVTTNASTANGGYQYVCTVHDFMVGTLNVSH